MSIVLNELLHWLHYARVSEHVKLLRIAACAGIAARPGSIVVTRTIYDGIFRDYYPQVL